MSRWDIQQGDCLDLLRSVASESVDAIVTDPPYPEIDRAYGRWTEAAWRALMADVLREARRVLKPTGSAVFVLAPNQERVGRTRPWLFEFQAEIARSWNLVQDLYWWNTSCAPTVHCQRKYGLCRPSVKPLVWAGAPDCYRNQDAVLWSASEAMKALNLEDRALIRLPSGQTMRNGRVAETVAARGGSTPFNLLPLGNAGAAAEGHPAATPYPLCEWLVRYLVPPGGLVLDPFTGSGTTGVAALRNACRFVGFEREPAYVAIAQSRLEKAAGAAPALRIIPILRRAI